MLTKFIEASNGFNWGKFMVAQFAPDEWAVPSRVGPPYSLLHQRGWSPAHVLVVDLETGEGALFRPGGLVAADLKKHRIWVCPLYEPFLEWLYLQDLTDLASLPDRVELPDAPCALAGYRRPGPQEG